MSKNKRKLFIKEASADAKMMKYEPKFDFSKPLPSLKELTAIQLSIALFYRQNLHSRNFPGYLHYDVCRESYISMSATGNSSSCERHVVRAEVKKSIRELSISPEFQTIIESYALHVEQQLKNWLYYHEQHVFFSSDLYANDFIDQIVWKSDGYIDYIATAENLLTSPVLSPLYKYRIRCTYCLKQEIEKNRYYEDAAFGKRPLVYYWNCYLNNQLDRMDISDATSVENYMIEKVDNWAAIEYFFDQLSEDDQVEKAITLIRRHGFMYQSILLTKLNDSQQHKVFAKCAKLITANCLISPSTRPIAVDVWDRCKNIIGKDVFEMFREILITIIDWKFKLVQAYTVSLLKKVWSSVPEELRSIASVESLLNSFFRNDLFVSDDVLELLFTMLRDLSSSPLYQKSIMYTGQLRRYCRKLIKEGNFADLYHSLGTFVPANKVTHFKFLVIRSRDMFDLFQTEFCAYKCDKLKKILDDVPDSRTFDYKLRMVESERVVDFITSELFTDRYEKLKELLDDVFKSDRDVVMLRICEKTEVLEKFSREINKGEFNRLKNSLELLITREDYINILKTKLLKLHKVAVVSGKIPLEKVHWKEFITWCCGDISNFRNSFSIDGVFLRLLEKSICIKFDCDLRYCIFLNQCCFSDIDNFLEWYFDSPEDIAEYKFNRILDFSNIKVISVLLQKKDWPRLSTTLRWFCDNNAEKMEQFKKTYCDSEVYHCIEINC